jgi:hypothetical protein
VHRAAHLLSNEQNLPSTELKEQYEQLLDAMKQHPSTSPSLDQMVAIFCKVTASYWLGLFHCYDIPDLPRTNNGMEQTFGSVRHQERRVTGRKGASPGLVVRGAVRLAAAVATKDVTFTAADLCPTNLKKWRELRADLEFRHDARRQQYRFRRHPEQFLACLEERLLHQRLPT